MTVKRISTGSPFEANIGYSRAVIADGWVFVAGTTGYDYATMTMPPSVAEQCQNCIDTIARVLEEAGSGLEHVVRANYVVPNLEEWPDCWPVTSKAFGAAPPASMLISAGLAEPEMKIEIEVTARIP